MARVSQNNGKNRRTKETARSPEDYANELRFIARGFGGFGCGTDNKYNREHGLEDDVKPKRRRTVERKDVRHVASHEDIKDVGLLAYFHSME